MRQNCGHRWAEIKLNSAIEMRETQKGKCMHKVAVALISALALTVALAQERTPSAKGADVYIISPKDGATLSSPVTVQFGLKGMGIAPAGIAFENSGHHHLLVDTDVPANLGMPLPVTDNVRHFGKGQTEAALELKPGKHTLQLLLADQNHIPHNPAVMSKKITITVK